MRASEGRHVVQAGESLWTIARGELGPTAGTAQVSDLVNQLWELNRASIASGDPSLIRAGQTLALPAGLK